MEESIELIREMPNLTFLHDTVVSTGIDFIPLALSLYVSMKQPGKRRKLQGTFSSSAIFLDSVYKVENNRNRVDYQSPVVNRQYLHSGIRTFFFPQVKI